MAAVDDILVTIPQGILRGKKEASLYDDVFYSFQRIPYAKPPVGDLRFKAPQPAEGWTGIRDATVEGAMAPAIDILTGTQGLMKGSDEDCLFVNVYTKETPKPGKKLPVLVWIHGGGYAFGSGNKSAHSPEYFMTHDIVFVSMNYRLGAFGFLSLKTLECPGNYGLKDIRLSLQWVQNNISYFGGDPDNVTIFGESAGGSAVHYHMLSPSCKGLFKRAIGQSGAAYNPLGYSRRPRECAYLLGKRLGCDAANDEELLDFLKKAPMEDIITKSAGLVLEIEGQRIGENILNFAFSPTSEPESEEAFIIDNPLSEKFQLDVPYITGVTEKEMLMLFFNAKQVPSWDKDEEFQDLVPRSLNLEKDSELSLKIAKKIREFYFKDGMNIDSLIDVMSDVWFNHGVHQAERRRIKNPKIKSPTFLYEFSYRAKSSPGQDFMSKMVGFSPEVKGVAHGEDIYYLFTTTLMPFPPIEKGSAEYDTMRRLVDLWVNFATTGNPTNEKYEVAWKPTSISDDVYLDIGTDLQLKKGFFKDRMEFWDEIFKLSGYED